MGISLFGTMLDSGPFWHVFCVWNLVHFLPRADPLGAESGVEGNK